MKYNVTSERSGLPTEGGFLRGVAPRMTRVDWPVLILGMLLLSLGVVLIYAMAAVDDRYLRPGIEWSSHVKKVAVTFPALLVGLCLRPRWLRHNAGAIYGLSIFLLLLVPFIGIELNNAKRWIALPIGFDLQPSELAKVALIAVLAKALYRNRLETVGQWTGPAMLAFLPIALVAIQPDLGTAITIVPITLGMFHLAGARSGHLAMVIGGGMLLAFGAWKLQWVQDYQLRRINTWAASFDPEVLISERNGAAFHTYQAHVSIGNGGVVGTGLGQGIANQAGYLPERESDSIFCVIAEEGGLLGTAAFLTVYALMIVLLLLASSRIRERYARLFVGGVGLYFSSHFFINIGVNVGLLPMTGLTLPLLSTGGSSMLASLGALGAALGVAAWQEPSLDQDAFR